MPMIQMPTKISGGSWIRLATTGAVSASRPSAIAARSDGAQQPTTKASRDTSNRSGSSCPVRCATTTGTSTARDSAEQRHVGHVGPHGEGADRQRGEHEVGRGRRVGDGGDDGDHEREDRDQRAHLVRLGRLQTGPPDIPRAIRLNHLVRRRLPPAPVRHRRLRRWRRPGLRVGQREPRAPFDVRHQRRAELWIGGQSGLVGGGRDELDPARALLFGDGQTEVLGEHVRVAAVLLRIGRWTAKDLAEPEGDVVRMILREVGEHGAEDRIGADAPVEGAGQPVERFGAPGPFVERWSNVGVGFQSFALVIP